jgi:hypothetical protein
VSFPARQRRNAAEGVPYRHPVHGQRVLIEFLFCLSFGIASAMGLTTARQVTSGFFRVHLWVLLGVQTLAALALFAAPPNLYPWPWIPSSQFWLAVAAAVLSYVGAVIWMYERPRVGKAAIWAVAACGLAGMALPVLLRVPSEAAWHLAGRISSGWLLGTVTTAMLLGHWYLNTPTMKLEPLRRLIVLLAIAVVLRTAVSGAGLAIELGMHPPPPSASWNRWPLFVSLRWLAGVFGVGLLTGLTWQTLKIPNTQSATGILYAAVTLAMIGELLSHLLSTATHYPI